MPNADDAWLGEHAYWQSKLGFVKSELMHGNCFQDLRFLCHHKLFTLQGAVLIKLFGFSLYILKSINLIYLALFCLIFYIYSRNKKLNPLTINVFFLLFLSSNFIFQYSFVYRPEISSMCFGFLSYILLERALNQPHKNVLLLVFSGLFSGLAASSHLNGLMFPLAGCITLLLNKKLWNALTFGLSVLPTLSIYFYDFNHDYNVSWWFMQMDQGLGFDRPDHLPYGLYHLFNLLSEQLRFFHSPKEISLSILLIVLLIIIRKTLKEFRILITYTLILIISLAVLAVHKTSYYMILYLPFLFLLAALSINTIWNSGVSEKILFNNGSPFKVRHLIGFLVIAYFLINSFYNFRIAINKYNPDNNRNFVKHYFKESTQDCNILAPMEFIFDEFFNYKMIQSTVCYSVFKDMGFKTQEDDFFKLTDRFGIDYIILDNGFIDLFALNKFTEDDFKRNRYQPLLIKNDSLILKKIY